MLSFILLSFVQKQVQMPRRKHCQHPNNHGKSAHAARGDREVSLELSHFLHEQFGSLNDPIRWLCSRCQSSETKAMQSRSTSEAPVRRNLSNCKLSSDHASNDAEGDDNTRESGEHDDDVSMNNSGDDVESMDEDPVGDAESLSYQQDEAMKKLSDVFKVLTLDPIHDR